MTAPAFVNRSTPEAGGGNTIDLDMPPDIVAGNLLLAILKCSAQSTDVSAPAGWDIATGLNNVNHQTIFFRWADGTEGASVTFTAPAVQTWTDGVCVQISGGRGSGQPFDDDTGSPVAGRDIVGSASSVSQSLTTTEDDCLLLYSDSKNNNSRTLSTAPSGMTSQSDATSIIHIFTQVKATAGASGSKQAVFTASSLHFNLLVAILPSLNVDGDADADFVADLTADGQVDTVGDAETEFTATFTADGIVESALQGSANITFEAELTAEGTVDGGGTGSAADIARFRAAFALGITEPELSTIDMGWLLREYWGRRAGIVGDLSTYSTYDIISVHFPGSHFIRDVV